MQNAATAPRNGPSPKRMTLAAVTRGRLVQPLRVLLYGPEGVGKSTFASNAPAPVFIGPEDGTATLDIARFPEPRTWADLFDAIGTLGTDSHVYQTVVLDTLDWIEPLCWRHVCQKAGKPDVEAFGYGKGYLAALDEWRLLISALDALRRTKGMHVVLLAHAVIRTFKNPEGDDYDRWGLKLNEKAGGLLKEWADAVLFANYETLVAKDGNRGKGVGGGARFIHTERRAAFDAKNRHDLDDRLPLDWEAFYQQIAERGPEAATKLRAAMLGKVERLRAHKPDAATKAASAIDAAGTDLSRLSQLDNRLTALLAECDAANDTTIATTIATQENAE